MCHYHRSWRKSWRLFVVRSSATVLLASGDSTGGRAHIEQIVDVLVPRILEQHVEVIKVILQKQCQRVRFFDSVWEGGCGQHGKSVLPPSPLPHTRGLILSASDGIWNTILTLHTLGKIQVQWLFVSCSWLTFAQLTIRPFVSCEPHSCRRSQASSQRPHLAARPPPCAARA